MVLLYRRVVLIRINWYDHKGDLPLRKTDLLPYVLLNTCQWLSSILSSLSLSLSRTDALLLKLSLLVGQQVFYGALWGTMVVSPMVRLPASVFIVTHFDRMASLRQQTHMLGYDHRLVVNVCFCLTAHTWHETHLIMKIYTYGDI